MTFSQKLASWATLVVAGGISGCGGGGSTAPSQPNKAPGAGAVVGVDMGMQDPMAVAPASAHRGGGAPAPSPAAAHAPSPADADYVPPPDSSAAPPSATGLAETPGAVTPLTNPAQMIANAGAANTGDANYVPPPDGVNAGAGAPVAQQPLPGGDGAGGGAPANTAQKGTAEYAVNAFLAMAKSGNYADSEEVISAKAKGLAGSIRQGDLPDDKVEAYKTSFANPQYLSNRNMGTGLQVVYSTVPGETATFLVVKEGQKFVIKEFKLTSSKGR